MTVETITVASAGCYTIQYFQNITEERVFLPRMKGECKMTPKEELLSYISNLTPEQVDKIINQLPQLISAIGAQEPPGHLELSLQNP